MQPFDLKTLIEFDKSVSALAEKVKTAIPKERGFRSEAQKHVTDLQAATRMFDAETVDYAKEILVDTQNQDAHTVTELVSFMLKYRLRFENAERSPISRVAYDQIYRAMRQQADLFGIKPPDPPAAPGAKAAAAAPVASDPASQFKLNSVWTNGDITLTVTERKGDRFRATWMRVSDDNHRIVNGTVRGKQISWLRKDVRVIKGKPGVDWVGTIENDKIDFNTGPTLVRLSAALP